MEFEKTTRVLGNAVKIEQKIFKFLAIFSVLISITAAIYWFLFHSIYGANLSIIIPIRNFYATVFEDITGNRPYTIQSLKPLQKGKYTYTFFGNFERLDTTSGTIYLKASNQDTYLFEINAAFREDSDFWLVIYSLPNQSFLTSETSLLKYRQTLIRDSAPAVPPSRLIVRWNDERTLTQIKKAYREDPQVPLNLGTGESTVLMEIKR